ncbi:MAG: hypothetical protein WC061_08555 [Melioribacteraceae bacterium]
MSTQTEKILNVFIVGPGKVGSAFLKLIGERSEYLSRRYNTFIKVGGLMNRSAMVFNPEGIDANNWRNELLNSSHEPDILKFIDKIKGLNLDSPIIVDSTANESVVRYYRDIFNSGISIVTPNKIANTQSYGEYLSMRETAGKNNVHFKYGTNVGSALPFISTLKDIVSNGDEILKIEGVFSGTLSFIFNSLKEKDSFSDIVLIARERGYTEPDPRDDLKGLDMARKLLILIRESGIPFELNDVSIEKLISSETENACSVEEFFLKLKQEDEKFIELKKRAVAKDRVLSYMAKYENGVAKLSIQEIGGRHPFFNLIDSENIVAFTTKNYWKNPLTIRGQGAGADFTAVGILSDLLRISNYSGYKL